MWFTRVSIHNPVFATMMMVALLVLGVFSYQRLPVDEFPDIKLPIVAVITQYPGGSPEIVATDVSRPIEEAVNMVSGISHISSESYEGLSVVIAQFQLSVDPVNAAQDVREKVASIRANFRKGVKEPTVERFDPKTFPVASISVRSAQRSLLELTMLTHRIIKRRFENIRGVGAVNVVGGTNREINIFLRPEAMYGLGVGVNQIIN